MNDAEPIEIASASAESEADPLRAVRWDTSRPFPRNNLAFMLWLTPMEWRLCYALSFAWNAEQELDASLSMSEQFRAVIHRLEYVHRYLWHAVSVDNDQQMWLDQDRPVSTDNFNWIAMMRRAEKERRLAPDDTRWARWMPSKLESLHAAVDYCHEHDELIDLCSLLEKTLAKVETDNERANMQFQAKLHNDPEFLESLRHEVRESIEILKQFGAIQGDMVH